MGVIYNVGGRVYDQISLCLDFANPKCFVSQSSFSELIKGARFSGSGIQEFDGSSLSVVEGQVSSTFFPDGLGTIDVTVTAWMFCSITSSTEFLVGKGITTPAWDIFTINNTASFRAFTALSGQSIVSGTIQSGWNFICGTHKTAVRAIYINGNVSQILSASHVRSNGNSVFYLAGVGGSAFASTTKFGEIRVYDRVLTAGEIVSEFSATRGRYGI